MKPKFKTKEILKAIGKCDRFKLIEDGEYGVRYVVHNSITKLAFYYHRSNFDNNLLEFVHMGKMQYTGYVYDTTRLDSLRVMWALKRVYRKYRGEQIDARKRLVKEDAEAKQKEYDELLGKS